MRRAHVIYGISRALSFAYDRRIHEAPGRILVEGERGVFRRLRTLWRFEPAGPAACDVSFAFEADFASPALAWAGTRLLEGAAAGMLEAFRRRADRLAASCSWSMLTPLPAGALVRVHLRRLAEGFRIRLGPAQVGLLRHVRSGRDGIELLRRGVCDARYLQQGMALWREVAEPSQGVGPGTWAVWDGGALFVGHDGGVAVEADTGPGERFAPREMLEAAGRLAAVCGGTRSAHLRVSAARAMAGAGVGITDLLRGSEAGRAMRPAPDPPGLALFPEGPVRLWASGTGEPGMWVLDGVADA